LVAAFGIGALLGAFIAAGRRIASTRQRRNLSLALALLVIGSAFMPNLAAELVDQACTRAVSIWFVALANGVLQVATAPSVRGRVMGLWSMGPTKKLPDHRLDGRCGSRTMVWTSCTEIPDVRPHEPDGHER